MAERFVITKQRYRATFDGGVHSAPLSAVFLEKLDEPTSDYNVTERLVDGDALLTQQNGELVVMKDGQIISEYPEGTAWVGGEGSRAPHDHSYRLAVVKKFVLVKVDGEE